MDARKTMAAPIKLTSELNFSVDTRHLTNSFRRKSNSDWRGSVIYLLYREPKGDAEEEAANQPRRDGDDNNQRSNQGASHTQWYPIPEKTPSRGKEKFDTCSPLIKRTQLTMRCRNPSLSGTSSSLHRSPLRRTSLSRTDEPASLPLKQDS